MASTVTTNGRIEPWESATARAGREGTVARVLVERGSAAAAGQVLVEIDSPEVEPEIRRAEARRAEAEADLRVFDQGGGALALEEIRAGIDKITVELEAARRRITSLERLVARNAETREALEGTRDEVRRLENDKRALEGRRAALLPAGGRAAVEARIREAGSALDFLRRKLELARVRSPIGGVVYSVAVKPGAFVRPGDPIADIGQVAELKAILYVDEPELGRVGPGMPVRLTWDAQPGRSWTGAVNRLPTQIVAAGTRQVGEVICRIRNTGGTLVPGANVNAEIQSRLAPNALTIPKEAVRSEAGQTGVFVLDGERVAWRPVKTGVSSLTRVEVVEGLREGDVVALVTATALRSGERVLPRFP